MKKLIFGVAVLVSLALVLGACSTPGTPAEEGAKLFARKTLEDQPGCITCHSLQPDTIIIGQSLNGIASRAGDIVPGLSAEEFIRQSILDPNAYLEEGYPTDTMPPVWDARLSEKQVDDLVAFLLTLK